MKILFTITPSLAGFFPAIGQKYITESGQISFFSSAPIEDIEAINQKVVSIFDSESGNLVFSVPIKDFEFDKSLMKEHFNEKYMETEKYPKSIFKGTVEGYTDQEGEQNVVAKGDLTIHGVTHQVEISGTIESSASNVVIKATFFVSVDDYDVEIPSLLFSNIAEVVEVTVDLKYKPYVK